jgi:hypothetical protein
MLTAAAKVLVIPTLATAPVMASTTASSTPSLALPTTTVQPTVRSTKRPKGMPDKRLRALIEQSFRGTYSSVRECDQNSNCVVKFDWSKIQWRGSARHCIAGDNLGRCGRWAKAFVARTDLLVTETTNPNWEGVLEIRMRQFGFWDNGRKRLTYTDGYRTGEAFCEPSAGCGKSLLVWQDEFKDWFYSFADVGDCCSAVRLT